MPTFIFQEVAHFHPSSKYHLCCVLDNLLLFFGWDGNEPFGQPNFALTADEKKPVYLVSDKWVGAFRGDIVGNTRGYSIERGSLLPLGRGWGGCSKAERRALHDSDIGFRIRRCTRLIYDRIRTHPLVFLILVSTLYNSYVTVLV